MSPQFELIVSCCVIGMTGGVWYGASCFAGILKILEDANAQD